MIPPITAIPGAAEAITSNVGAYLLLSFGFCLSGVIYIGLLFFIGSMFE